MNDAHLTQVRSWLLRWQQQLIDHFSSLNQQTFQQSRWHSDLGEGLTCVLEQGSVIEKGGINFSYVRGSQLPAAASAAHPELAGCSYQAMGVSLVMHPRNPYVPVSHANLRFFMAEKPGQAPIWWFGGGYDLTPCYPFLEDVIHWHQTARAACLPFGDAIYPAFKQACDDYFYLPHRQETRGVGGLFFDDLKQPDFATCFALLQSIGNSYLPAYQPLIERRQTTPYGQRELDFLAYRRGRYVEFNLVWDRGTLFGLQSGGRTESILMSLPPQA